ncbi:MAG: class I tRNA ligase family protein, partial [Thermoleophilaceae bacterium]
HPTSRAPCTWATRSTGPTRTCSSAAPGCRDGGPSGSSAPTTRASPPRSRSSRLWPRRASAKEDLGREAFAERVWEWRRQYGDVIKEQFQKLGASLDYEDERFTMDEAYARAVAEVFTALYEKGLIYRDNFMVNWDPGTRSAISDLEVEQRRTDDTLYMVDYPLESGSGSVTVATVRPETMLADTAIAVNPDDERYTRLIGERATLPLVGRSLPIIGDPYVKTDFGTGALKITPGHDPNDFEIGRRHGLEEISVIGEDGRMTAAAGEPLRGHDRRRGPARRGGRPARGRLLVGHPALLARRALLAPLGRADRAADLAAVVLRHGTARRAGHRGRARRPGALSPRAPAHPGLPRLARKTSGPGACRASSGGATRSPPWYRGDEMTRGRRGARAARAGSATPTCWTPGSRPGCGPSPRWAGPRSRPSCAPSIPPTCSPRAATSSSCGWPGWSCSAWSSPTRCLFSDVSINSTIMAPDGRRMSKSLGTGIDPLDQIAEYGADAVRFGLVAMASTQDVRFSVDRVRQGLDLANKLWNASRLILLGVQEGVGPSPDHAL